MDEPRFDPLDYVSVLNRRKWWFIVPVVLSIVVGVMLVWLLPRSYQATTTVAVSSPRVAPNVVGAAEINREERMRAVSQQLLSRAVLERTARLEKLDQNQSIDAAVNDLRSEISVLLPESLTPGSGPSQLSPEQKAQLDSYLISVEDTDPRYYHFWPDVGHLAACGVDPMETYKKYRSRMIGTHLRDVAGPAEPPARARMVPFGEGIVKLPALIAFLRGTKFTGCVMGEGAGNQPMHDYMAQTLGLEM